MGTQYDKSQNNHSAAKPITENTLKDLATQLESVTVDPETRHREIPKMKFSNNRAKTKPDTIPKKLKSILRNKKGKSILTKQRKCVRFCEELFEVKKDKKPNTESSSPKSEIATNNKSLVICNESLVIHNDSAEMHNESVAKHEGNLKLVTNMG